MLWTMREIQYLELHAADGAAAIAQALGRSERAVRQQATRYGISLRKSWICPRCSMRTYHPLSGMTGWCCCCTKESRIASIAQEVVEVEREVARLESLEKERHRLNEKKRRLKARVERWNQD